VSNPLHAAYYADQALQRTVRIIENVPMARDTWRVRFEFPDLASRIVPGQFLMLRITGLQDPLIGRPFAFYDVVASPQGELAYVDVVYLVKGKLTQRLATLRDGAELDVWGPLGNGFEIPHVDRLILAAGGIGQTPFLALGQEALGRRRYGNVGRVTARVNHVTLCYGARNASYLAGVEEFRTSGLDVRVATDDGSQGHHGFVTDLVGQAIAESTGQTRHVIACGPEPMMEAVARLTAAADVTCDVSLETPMACGIGVCFSCVARVRDDHGVSDYKRTCVEGPVFNAARIEW